MRATTAVALLLLLVAAGAGATTYYVGPDGSNSNAGTSALPWADPAYGASRLQPGDTLIILGGRYTLSDFDEDIIRPASGSSGAWVTIRGESGNRPLLAGRDDLYAAVILDGASYVRVENLEITHDDQASGQALYFRDGINITGAPSSHIVLADLYVHHLDEFGLDAQDVDDLQVLNSRFEHCGFGAVGGPAGEQGGLRNLVISDSSLSYSGHYYQGGDGSNRPYDRPDGFGCETSVGPILIEDTTAEHNYGDGLDSKASNTTIRRSMVANNSCDGVKLWGGGSRVESTLIYGRGDGDGTPTPWAAVVIDTTEAGASFELVNVTVDDTLGQNYMMYVQYDDATSISLTIRNSIFRGAGQDCPIWLRDTVSLTADHNLFYLPQNTTILIHGSTEYTAANISGLGGANVSAEPLFIAPAWGSDGNYHLRSDSPAIDAGTPVDAPADDLDGAPRDATPDLGAYEYAPASQCTLTCQATVPATAAAGSLVAFTAAVTVAGCGQPLTYAWTFGDGGQSTLQSPGHTYMTTGSYDWSLAASADAVSCTATGTITVGPVSSGRPLHSDGQVIPQVAHLKGKGVSYWTTDLTLANPTTVAITTKLYFTAREAHGLIGYAEAEVTVPAGACRTYTDVVALLFRLSGAGSLEVASTDLIVATRTFTAAAGGGSYGQGCPPVAQGTVISASDGLRLLAGGVIAGSGARSNLALNEVWGEAAGVRVRLLDRDGTQLGSRTYQLQPYGNTQVNDVAKELGALSVLAEGQVEVTVTQGTGRVAATLFIVDGSDDPATVPLVAR